MFGSGAAGRDLPLAGFAVGDGPLAGGGRAVPAAAPAAIAAPPAALALGAGASSAGTGASAGVATGSASAASSSSSLLGLLVLVRLEQIRGVEEGALFLTDVHEGRLDAGQHRFDPTQVDVADGAPMVRAVHEQLHQTVVLQDGHAGFPLAPVDQDLALQVMTSAAAERSGAHPASGRRGTLG